MPPEQAAVIRERYYAGKKQKDVAANTGVGLSRVRRLEENAMLYLRRPKNTQRLHSFMYPDFYVGNGLQAFKNRGYTSRVEVLAMETLTREGL